MSETTSLCATSTQQLLHGSARWRAAWWALSAKTLRLLRRAWLRNALLFLVLPLLLIFLLGISRFGLKTPVLGVAAPSPLPLSFGGLVPSPKTQVLAWASELGGGGVPANPAAVVAAAAAAAGNLPTVSFPSHEALLAGCVAVNPPPCFAGVTFWPSVDAAAGNVTITFPQSAIAYGPDASGFGPLGAAGILSLQLTLERALIAAANATLAPALASAVTAAQPFTFLSRAQFNSVYYGYYYDFVSQTGAAVAVVIFLPHIFWLVTAMVAEVETGIRDVLLISGLPHAAWLATFLGVAVLVFVPCWVVMAAVMQPLFFALTGFGPVVLMLLLNGLALMTLCVLLTHAFRRAWMAGFGTLLIVFLMALVGLGASLSGSTAGQGAAAALLAPAGLVIGVGMLAHAEEADVPVDAGDWFAAPVRGSGLSFGALLAAMLANALLNGGIAWALARRSPNATRAREAAGSRTGSEADAAAARTTEAQALAADARVIFTAAAGGAGLEDGSILARVRGLRKRFPAPRGGGGGRSCGGAPGGSAGASAGAAFAVDGVSFDLRAGEVLALLGRNGCGKTTTIGMLTGLLAPTAGGASFTLPGQDTRKHLSLHLDMPSIRQHIGLCPQHDVLWPDLSVTETLAVYAAVKGVPAADVPQEVAAWVARIGLADKAGSPVCTLSGGQRRRVSLASAYIGGSKIVFLDEPTSGIDPASRRAVWEIVQGNAVGRAVILTTHHLDEGEVLAQRVALLSAGRLLALGTPAALKQRLGLGYHVVCTLRASELVQDEAAAAVADASHPTQGSSTRRDTSLGPSSSSHAAAALLEAARDIAPAATLYAEHGQDVTLDVPFEVAHTLPALLRHLQANAQRLSLEALGVNSASLQDLFTHVIRRAEAEAVACAGAAPAAVAFGGRAASALTGGAGAAVIAVQSAGADTAAGGPAAACGAAALMPSHSSLVLDAQQPSSRQALPPASCSRRMGALLRKRALLAARDPLATGLPFILAVVFAVVVAIAFPGISFSSCPASLTTFSPQTVVTTSTTGVPLFGALSLLDALPPGISVAVPPGVLAPAQAPTPAAGSAALSANASALYGGVLPYSATGGGSSSGNPLWPDTTAAFVVGGPAYTDAAALNAIDNALWRAAAGLDASSKPGVVTALQPFLAAVSPADMQDITPYVAAAFVVVVAVAVLAPLASTVVVAREVHGGMKAQQRVTGVTALQYWGAHLLWDTAAMALCCLALAVALVSGPPGWRPDFAATLLLLLLSAVNVVLLGYVFSMLLPSVTSALAATICYGVLIAVGMFAGVVTQLTGGSGSAAELASSTVIVAVTYACMAVNPLCNLLWGIVLGTNALLMACGGPLTPSGMWSYVQLGRPLALLGAQVLLLFVATLALESLPAWRMRALLKQRRKQVRHKGGDGAGAALLASAATGGEGGSDGSSGAPADADVAVEAATVAALLSDRAAGGSGSAPAAPAVLVSRLRREYAGGFLGVERFDLQMAPGEAVGLLGVNGAGKSTLVRMLVGLDVPTAGDVHVSGAHLLADPSALQRRVGYAPQFDVLFPGLSAEEHLRFYGALRGLAGQQLDDEVAWLLQGLDLNGSTARKPSAALSGGNRRKLSAAIALLGSPPLVVLDEISTGVDPMSKQVLWRALSRLRGARQSLLLVTHSMEECEACTQRVAVMACGRIVGLGSAQHLKSRFGAALQVDAEVAGNADGVPTEAAIDAFCAAISTTFPGSKVLQRHNASVRASIPLLQAAGTGDAAAPGSGSGDSDGAGGSDAFIAAFEWLVAERAAGTLAAFTVSQTSLEQVFLDLTAAAGQRPPADSAPDARGGRGTASYWNVPGEAFSIQSMAWLLIVSPALSWILMGAVVGLYLASVFLAVIPPLCKPFAAATLSTLRWAAGVERVAQARYCHYRPPSASSSYVAAGDDGGRGSCCGSLFGAAMARLFCDAPTRRALLYFTVVKPLVLSFVGFLLCVLSMCAGMASVFLLWPAACILTRRYTVWQRAWLHEFDSFA